MSKLTKENLSSTRVIANNLKKATAENLQTVLLNILGHAHFNGNINPIVQNIETIRGIQGGMQMIAFLRKHAPVKYNAKDKAFSYVREEADREIDLEALPMWNHKAEEGEKTVSGLAKVGTEAQSKKVAAFEARIEATTDMEALKTQEAVLKAQLKAIQTKLAAPRAIAVAA